MALKVSINKLWTSCTSMPRKFCRKLPFSRMDTGKNTFLMISHLGVKYPAGAHTVCGNLRGKNPRLEKTAAIKDSHRTTKNRKSWSEDSEPLTLFGRLGLYTTHMERC